VRDREKPGFEPAWIPDTGNFAHGKRWQVSGAAQPVEEIPVKVDFLVSQQVTAAHLTQKAIGHRH
jgi:hypothetical protein